MGRYELARSRWRSDPWAGQHCKCIDILPHGGFLLLLECHGPLHRHQGSTDLWNVSLSTMTSALLKIVGGTMTKLTIYSIGYAPYAAGLYTNNRFGNEWLVLLGAALCGISAGVFWMAEAAIAIAYPEPWNRGKALGYWLTYRLSGQIIGGAINLGLNADRNEAGKVSYTVFQIFIALQAAGPFVAFLLNRPHKVQRKDGKKVNLSIVNNPLFEIKATTRLFFTKKFLLLVLFIGQAVFAESVFFTYLACELILNSYAYTLLTRVSVVQRQSSSSRFVPGRHHSHHLRQPSWREYISFILRDTTLTNTSFWQHWLDRVQIPLKIRARYAFATIVTLQGGWWIWATILVTKFHRTRPTYDWATPGFGAAFAVLIFLTMGFQLNYMFL